MARRKSRSGLARNARRDGLAGRQSAGEQIDPAGGVSHATNVVEHPELVAERIVRFANLVGRQRVIASTGCGLGGRTPADRVGAGAKLEALARGAALATRRLWR